MRPLAHYQRQLEYALGSPFTQDNEATVLLNGDQIFASMLEAINAAENRIDFLTFIYWNGRIADQFADSLSKRAKMGVTVRVLLDAFGAQKLDAKLAEMMQTSGVELRWFRPLSTWRVWRSDKRTHRKILVCDDKVGFIGGVGIADQWAGNARGPQEWRETHVRVRGPALMGLRASFLDNWNEAGDWLFEPVLEHDDRPGDVSIQVLSSSTTIEWTRISCLVRTLIELAESKLYITAAYFAPDRVIIELLCAAAGRGVDVRLLVPGEQTDSRLSQLAGQSSYAELLDCGVKILRYRQTLLHAKLLTIDGIVSCVGSANLNHRSLSKDEECSIVMLSKVIADELDQQFLKDCETAKALSLSDWSKRSALERFKERVAGVFIEQL